MATSPTFITELPLLTSSHEEAILRKRFWAAKQQYNALLGEAQRQAVAGGKGMLCDSWTKK